MIKILIEICKWKMFLNDKKSGGSEESKLSFYIDCGMNYSY